MNDVVLLLGASRGIGAACARAFFATGNRVCLAARSEEPLEAARRHAGPSALARVTDIADAGAVQETVDAILDTHGRIDTVINFAGQTGPLNRPVWGVKPEDWHALMQVNLEGTYNIVRSIIPVFQKAGHGRLIVASSPFGDRPRPGMGGYCASRAAGNMLIRQLAGELHGSRIGTSLVYPGLTDTDGLTDFREAQGSSRLGGQVASAEEMARLFLWVAGKAPWELNGQVYAWSDQNIRSQVEGGA
ncbi:MAG: SDR family oxidoreductase [Marinibacterium sp.]